MRRESQVLRRSPRVGNVYRETIGRLGEIGEQLGPGATSHPIGNAPTPTEALSEGLTTPPQPREVEKLLAGETCQLPLRQQVKPRLWTPDDLASYLQVNVNWIYRRSPEDAPDRIPHIRMGKLLRFDADSEEFKNWLKAHGKN